MSWYTLSLCRTVQRWEDLLMPGLPSALCPGSECDRQSGHLLLQLPVCSSPWGAEVSEPFHHCIFVSCLLSVCPVPRSGFYVCQAHSSSVDKTWEFRTLIFVFCLPVVLCCSETCTLGLVATGCPLQIFGTAMRCSHALLTLVSKDQNLCKEVQISPSSAAFL